MEGEGEVLYRTVPWDRRLLAQRGKRPAGPLFKFTCLKGSVCQLHLPHCEIYPGDGCDFLSVAHVTDDIIEFLDPHEITETHIIINITGFCDYGLTKDKDAPVFPIKAFVLLFHRPSDDPELESVLHVLLLPRNVDLMKVKVGGGCGVPLGVVHNALEGYRLQIRCRPQSFRGLRVTMVADPLKKTLRLEISSLTRVPSAERLARVLQAVSRDQWFVTLDLRDAYFHVPVHPAHWQYLRFTFEGTAYEFMVLPFGLFLAPHTFTKCLYAVLAPLTSRGLLILNYLDNWLICAPTRTQVLSDRDTLLIGRLSITVNDKKSRLMPTQRVAFIGMELDSVLMRARLPTRRVQAILSCLDHFRQGRVVSALTCQRLLGLLTAASLLIPLGLLHLRRLQWWFNSHRLLLLSLRWGGDAEDVPPGAGQHRRLPDRLWGCDQGQVGQRLLATPLERQAHQYTRAPSCTAGPADISFHI
ncbi:hypothetical protein J4Q44_G00290400 [Coregonus suidteri]|uniref:ribonuclease H n=1 Tax=Coregonus suidteri TaxID=861788 RepID=A0AAN8L095_9TELE